MPDPAASEKKPLLLVSGAALLLVLGIAFILPRPLSGPLAQNHDLLAAAAANGASADLKGNGSDGPITINLNDSVDYSWSSTGVSSCSVNWTGPTSGNVPWTTNGSEPRGPYTLQGTYTINFVCNTTGGTVSDTLILNVGQQSTPPPPAPTPPAPAPPPPPPPPAASADLKANGSDGPVTINVNDYVDYSWSSQGVSSCNLSWTGPTQGSGPWSMNGAQHIGPYTADIAGTYTIVFTCNKTGGGTVSDSLTLIVGQPSTPPAPTATSTVDLRANLSDGPVTIHVGDPVYYEWSSQGMSSCTLSWTGAAAGSAPWSTSGARSIGPYTASQAGVYTVTLTCTKTTGGTASDSLKLTVAPVVPSVDLKINNSDGPVSVNVGESATYSWNAENVGACTLSVSGASTGSSSWSKSGTQSVGPFIASQVGVDTVTFSCARLDGGTLSDSVALTVKSSQLSPPAPSSVNVRDYGAKGDGATDDSQSIQKAIDAAATGSTIVFPAGTYLINRTLALRSSHTYQGTVGQTILKAGSLPIARRGTYSSDSTSSFIAMLEQGAHDITLDGITFAGRGITSQTDTPLPSNITITHNSFNNIDTYCPSEVWCPDNYAVFITALGNSKINSNTFQNVAANSCGGGAVLMYRADTVSISDNTIDNTNDALDVSAQIPGRGDRGDNITMDRNRVTHAHMQGLNFIGLGSNLRMRDNVVAIEGNNTCTVGGLRYSEGISVGGNGFYSWLFGYGISGGEISRNTVVARNTSVPQNGMAIELNGGDNFLIQGNDVEGSWVAGIVLGPGGHRTVSGNYVCGPNYESSWYIGYEGSTAGPGDSISSDNRTSSSCGWASGLSAQFANAWAAFSGAFGSLFGFAW